MEHKSLPTFEIEFENAIEICFLNITHICLLGSFFADYNNKQKNTK